MTIQTIADTIKSKMDPGTDIGSTVKFDCGDDGVIVIDGQNVSTENADADCTILCDIDVLEDLVSGELNSTAAFMTGKIKIEGDMGVAMKLSSIL